MLKLRTTRPYDFWDAPGPGSPASFRSRAPKCAPLSIETLFGSDYSLFNQYLPGSVESWIAALFSVRLYLLFFFSPYLV